MAAKNMQKLFGNSASTLQSGYLAEDHLLIVNGRFQERYKRLKYADIQALLIRRTAGGKVLALCGGLGGFLFLIIALTQMDSSAWIAWGVIAIVSWAIFALSLYGQGTAQMGVQTAVQTVFLEGVTTLRKAEKVAVALTARVEAEQGRLEPEVLRAALEKKRVERREHYTVDSPQRPETPPRLNKEAVVRPEPPVPDTE
jgi:hypothetical protein